MGRLIDADELQSKVADKLHFVFVNEEGCYLKNNKTEIHYGLLATEISDVIEEIPTVEERKHGHWVCDGTLCYCSECHEEKRFPHWTSCPNCGAKMDEVSEDER